MLYLKCLTNINIATIARRPSDSLVGSGLAVLLIEQFLGCFGNPCIELLGTFGGFFFVSLAGGGNGSYLPFDAVDPVFASLHVVPGGVLDVAFDWIGAGSAGVGPGPREGGHETRAVPAL